MSLDDSSLLVQWHVDPQVTRPRLLVQWDHFHFLSWEHLSLGYLFKLQCRLTCCNEESPKYHSLNEIIISLSHESRVGRWFKASKYLCLIRLSRGSVNPVLSCSSVMPQGLICMLRTGSSALYLWILAHTHVERKEGKFKNFPFERIWPWSCMHPSHLQISPH